MQVANDAASAKEAGALTTPLPESCRAASSADCVEGLEHGLAGGERGVRGV